MDRPVKPGDVAIIFRRRYCNLSASASPDKEKEPFGGNTHHQKALNSIYPLVPDRPGDPALPNTGHGPTIERAREFMVKRALTMR